MLGEVQDIYGKLSGKHSEQGYDCCCYWVAQLCLTLCSPMNCSMSGFSVLYYLLEFAQTHVHGVSDAIQPSQSSVAPFTSCSQSFPASGSFPKSWLFLSHGQSIEASASASVLLINIQGLFPLGFASLISLLSKELSRVFSSTIIWKHQFFSAQPSLCPTLTSVHDYWENHSFDYMDLFGHLEFSRSF